MAKHRSRGEGTIYQRKDGRWCTQISLPNGKRKTKYAKTQREVREWLLTQRHEVKRGDWVDDETLTVGDFLDRYRTEVLPGSLRETTLESYNGVIERHIKPGLGQYQLAKLKPQHVQSFYAAKSSAKLSQTTVRYIHAILHKALAHAVRFGLVSRNVSDLVVKPKARRSSPQVWSLEDARRFIEATRADRLHALYVLAVFTGLRQGELLGLQASDVDWSSGSLHVRQALALIKGKGLTLMPPKTDRSRRTIKLPVQAVTALRAHLGDQKEGYVFTTGNATPILARNLVRDFKALLKAAGLPIIRFHDLRHTCATLHLAAGTNPKVVQDILGHSTINLTLGTYSHVLPAIQDEAAERFAKLMGG